MSHAPVIKGHIVRGATTYPVDTRPCARCGIVRYTHGKRAASICRDCYEVVGKQEAKEVWAG